MAKIQLICLGGRGILDVEEWYKSELGHVIKREDFTSPNGNTYNGHWVLRDQAGQFIDHDRYRSDLMERNNFDSNAQRLEELLKKEFA